MTLEILTADALAPLRHGFFTRRGGASSGVFAGLNCGAGSSDQAEAVRVNRARVAEALEVAPEALITPRQTHSPDVAVIDDVPQARPVADALVTDAPGLALGVLTADCQPILMTDAEAGVIGAVHAGWRGALAGVVEAAVAAMEGRGARRARIAAVIGPTISQQAYEVGPELVERFIDLDRDLSRFFADGDGGKARLDLPGLGLHLLRAAGVGAALWTRHCTYSEPDRFYSYRRACHDGEADHGRLISAIRS